MSRVTLHDGTTLVTHDESECLLPRSCPIHSPSDHPLNSAPMQWVTELSQLLRVCEHGITHPDPDDLRVKTFLGGLKNLLLVEAITSVHLVAENCDGCCHSERNNP